jgi:pimeloyl-ACP methyl ester carboxylesterase
MTQAFDIEKFAQLAQNDRELAYKLRGLDRAVLCIETPHGEIDLSVAKGRVVGVGPAQGDADLTLAGLSAAWADLGRNPPPPGYESLALAGMSGVRLQGDLSRLVAPYHPAWERVFQLIGETLRGGPVRRREASPEPFRESDDPVGRYVWLTIDGIDYRVFYEAAGTGPTPLVLQHTAGCDGRQYRHLLADPAMQREFTMIAYDLPYHGRSLPPSSREWWAEGYSPDQQWYVEAVVAICDALKLERPVFMGCSVGGQLALDLAAFAPERFRAVVALNGWYHMDRHDGFTNDIFRDPAISDNLYSSNCYGATAPSAPEANRQETYWIYRSNYPGIYAGDNDYFMFGHDLRRDGHLIDTSKIGLYAVAGEYDPCARLPGGLQEIATRIPGAKVEVLEGLSHFAPSDDPVGFNQAILPILREAARH